MSITKHQETEDRIRELRESIDELERQLRNIIADQESVQHESLEHLDEYINAVDTKVSSVKVFWQTLKNEWQSR
ncbi:MAG: hypothetical protein LRY66_17600 [Saccharospirillaceae bacterium]|nr:hypothetical protein [Saccharospirillaceae bacterium]MCD8533120.1 hypothetical protein [Saccharospirillaceae bacterium]